jgi:hypothetical protein
MPDPSCSEFEIAFAKVKKYNSPGSDEILVFISLKTTMVIGCTLTLLDRPTFQLPSTTTIYSHHHWLCIFTSDEQESACCSHKAAPAEDTHFLTAVMMVSLSGKCCPHSPFIGLNRWK